MAEIRLSRSNLRVMLGAGLPRPRAAADTTPSVVDVLRAFGALVGCDAVIWYRRQAGETAATVVLPAAPGSEKTRLIDPAPVPRRRLLVRGVGGSVSGTGQVVAVVRDDEDFAPVDVEVARLLGPHLDRALRAARAPRLGLTPRQEQVMELVRDGLTDRQIAGRLGCAESTVGKHLEHVYRRTGARCRAEAVARLTPWTIPSLGIDRDGDRC